MVTPPTTPPSSPSGKLKFIKETKAWLMTTLAEKSIKGHAPRTFFTVIYLHFNYEHWQATGDLIAWPSWETMKRFGLSEGGIKEGIKEGEARGFIEVQRGRRKDRRRDVNVYRALSVNRQRQPVEVLLQPAFPEASRRAVEMETRDSNGEKNGDGTQPAISAGSRVDSVNRTPEQAALRPEAGKAVPSSDSGSAKTMTPEEEAARAAALEWDQMSAAERAASRRRVAEAARRWRQPVATNGSGDL